MDKIREKQQKAYEEQMQRYEEKKKEVRSSFDFHRRSFVSLEIRKSCKNSQ